MPDPDEVAWGVGTRAGALRTLNQYVQRGGTGNVLYYPGSGADVMNPLFATYSATTYMVFADILASLAGSIDGAIHSTGSRQMTATEAAEHATKLKITSTPAGGWIFRFKNVDRHILLFRAGHDAFLAANGQFTYDILFDKDFWETSAEIDLGVILPRLRPNGFYLTNNSIGLYRPFLEDLGLQYYGPVTLNGAQYVWRKVAPTPNDASQVQTAVTDARKASATFLFGELTFADNSPNWTPADWIDVLAGAIIAGRNAIVARMAMGDAVWDAMSAILVEELHAAAVFAHDAQCAAAAQLARTASPNFAAITARATALLA